MTTFVHSEFSMRHDGVVRVASFVEALNQQFGSPLRHLVESVSRMSGIGVSAAEEERQLWEAALDGDSIMADILFAMKESAPNRVAYC